MVKSGKCPRHRREAEAQYRRTRPRDPGASARAARYRGEWPKIRAAQLKKQPMCEAPGCSEKATVVHHKQPKMQGGGDEPENLASMCRAHHAIETGHEKKRANAIVRRQKWEEEMREPGLY